MAGEKDDLVERYKRAREISRNLASDLVAAVPRKAVVECAKRLGLWEEGRLVFGHQREAAILYDFCIYDWRENGLNLAQKKLKSAPPPAEGSEEHDVLQSMASATYAMMQVLRVIEGVGVEAYDSLHLCQVTLADVGLSGCAAENMLIASRVFPFEDFVMTSGVPLTVDAEALSRITAFMKDRLGGGYRWFMDVDGAEQSEITASIIRILLEAGAAGHMKYRYPGRRPRS